MALPQIVEKYTNDLLKENKPQQVVIENRETVIFLLNQTGCLLHKHGLEKEGIRWMEIACNLGPEQALPWSNLAVMKLDEGCFEDALSCSEKSLEMEKRGECWYNHGVILLSMFEWEEAIAAFQKALEQPCSIDENQIRFNLGCCLFQLGRTREALQFLECRIKKSGPENARNRYKSPDWDGKKSLKGKIVLVISEQGIGDSFMFCRYLPDLAKTGAKIILEVQEPARTLFEQFGYPVYGRDVEWKDPVEPVDHDVLVCYASLPLFFDPELKKRHCPYIKATTKKLPGESFKVGVCWAGNKHYPNDKDRSCPGKYFKALEMPGVTIYNLQRGELVRGNRDLTAQLNAVEPELTDFKETAELIMGLDLVISVDTAVAHLSAALGKPTWLLLSACHDWRWMRGEKITPWYPSMEIWTQNHRDEWEELLLRVASTLKQHASLYSKSSAHSL